MFGVCLTELIVIFIVALVIFGPEKLPEMARHLGKLMSELRKGSDAVRREFYNVVYPPAEELRRDFAADMQRLRAVKAEMYTPHEGLRPPVADDTTGSSTTQSQEPRVGPVPGEQAPAPESSPSTPEHSSKENPASVENSVENNDEQK